MTTATKEKTWAEKTLEAIPEILKNTSMTSLIDCGLESGLGEYSGLASLVQDEEAREKDEQYELHQGNVKNLAKGLPEVFREDIDNSLEKMREIFVMERHDGAQKMADVLIRFYVRHHLGLDV